MAYYNPINCDSQAGIPGSRVGEKLDKMIVKGSGLDVWDFFLFPFKNPSAAGTRGSHGGNLLLVLQ